jgi:Lamin Tail Domain
MEDGRPGQFRRTIVSAACPRLVRVSVRIRSSLFLTVVVVVAGMLAVGPAEASSPIQFGKIQYDSPGSDTRSNSSLNAEYVVIKNVGATNRTLTGFTVRDAQNHVYRFGAFTLKAGKSLRLHTGKGTNTSTDGYWGSGSYIWNNSGDKAVLKTGGGTTLDSCSWASTGAGYKYC